MAVRFLHTSDWQLGVTRHFLNDDSQARWTEARYEGVRNLCRIAQEEDCEFIVVAGDIFESNQVDRRTVVKACDAMASTRIPIFLLPANHDPLDAGSVFTSKTWKERKPNHVQVIESTESVFEVKPGVEVVGAPWTSKRPLKDLVDAAAAQLKPQGAGIRIMLGHGAVSSLSPDPDNPAVINVANAEAAILENRYSYLALGDRHSFTQVGGSQKIFYSGTHEAYDFDEVDPGKVLIVDFDGDAVRVTPKQNGTWRFLVHEAHVNSLEDVEALSRDLESIPNKEKTVLKLGLVGSLSIQVHIRLEEVEEHAKDLFAAVVRSETRSELNILPAEEDFDQLALTGFAASTVEKLKRQASSDGPEQQKAADALALFLRLLRRVA